MLSFREFRRETSQQADVEFTSASAISEASNPFYSKVEKIVDDFVNQLKAELMKGSATTAQVGMWDRFKHGLSNLWYGRENPNNPYANQNRFGELGRKAESVTNVHVPLDDYKLFREAFSTFEEEVGTAFNSGTANLRIMRIIDDKAAELKRKLRDVISAVGSKLPGDKPFRTPPAYRGPSEFAKSRGYGSPEAEKNIEPPSETETEPSSPPPPAPTDGFHHELMPKTKKKWDQLTIPEKESWNGLGGGVVAGSHRAGVELPYIVRLGDPRRKDFSDERINYLKRMGRLETKENAIKSKAELEERVAEVKRKFRSTAAERAANVEQPAATRSRTRTGVGERSGLGGGSQTTSSPPPSTSADDDHVGVPVPMDAQPQEETERYKKLKTAADKVLNKHPWSSEEEKSKFIEIMNGGQNKESELEDAIKNTLKKKIEDEPSEEEKARLSEELDKAESPEELATIIGELYFDFLPENTRRLISRFRQLCQG